MAVFIIFSKSRNTFPYPLSKTRMQTPFETPFSSCCIYHQTLSQLRVERKALSLRSCIAQFNPKTHAFTYIVGQSEI